MDKQKEWGVCHSTVTTRDVTDRVNLLYGTNYPFIPLDEFLKTADEPTRVRVMEIVNWQPPSTSGRTDPIGWQASPAGPRRRLDTALSFQQHGDDSKCTTTDSAICPSSFHYGRRIFKTTSSLGHDWSGSSSERAVGNAGEGSSITGPTLCLGTGQCLPACSMSVRHWLPSGRQSMTFDFLPSGRGLSLFQVTRVAARTFQNDGVNQCRHSTRCSNAPRRPRLSSRLP